MKIKCNSVPNFAKGEVVDTPDTNGVPHDQFWRKRLRDAALDKCCEVVKPANKKAKVQPKLKTENEGVSND